MGKDALDLTEAEWKLLECLWDFSPRTGRETVDYMSAHVGWTRSTTLTMLRRMSEKGLISCDESGAVLTYSPLVRREDAVTFLARYKDYDVTGHYGTEHYSATVYGREDVIHRNIDITTDGYATEFRQFEHMVRTGKMIQSYDNFIRPVFILDAIHTAMETGKTVKLEYPTV